jgi:hypothetical protein
LTALRSPEIPENFRIWSSNPSKSCDDVIGVISIASSEARAEAWAEAEAMAEAEAEAEAMAEAEAEAEAEVMVGADMVKGRK